MLCSLVLRSSRSSGAGASTAKLLSPILAAASRPLAGGGQGFGFRGGNLSAGPLIAILAIEDMVNIQLLLCVPVALASIEVGTHLNNFFTLLPLSPLPPPPVVDRRHRHCRLLFGLGGRRTDVAMTYAGKLRLIATDNCQPPQDFANQLMRLCINAFGPHGFPRQELAKMSGTTFLAKLYTVSSANRQEPSSKSLMLLLSSLSTLAFTHNQHRHVLLRQYLEGVPGLADDGKAWAARSLHSSLPVTAAANVMASVGGNLLRVGNGMEVEAVNLEVAGSQEEPKRRSVMQLSFLIAVAVRGG